MKYRVVLALTATLLAVPAPPAQAGVVYGPQGGKWDATSVEPTYHEGMHESIATQHAIRSYQRFLGLPATGHYDAATTAAVLAFQLTHEGLRLTGHIDLLTSRELLRPTITAAALKYGVPAKQLCGHLTMESRLDLGAVGPTGKDLGVAQIVAKYGDGTNPWDPAASMAYMARRDAAANRLYGTYWGPVYYWNSIQAKARTQAAINYAYWVTIAPCDGF